MNHRHRTLLLITTLGSACAEARDDGDDGWGPIGAVDDGESGIDPQDTDEGEADDDGGGTKLDVGVDDTGAATGADGSACGCAPKSDKVYVLSDSAELWLFDPSTLEFTALGAFDCGLPPTTFSMGVARDGKAWIMFQPTGQIFLVDVNDANACAPSGWQPSQFGYNLFGMAFASESPTDSCDDLYLHSFDGGEWAQGPNLGMLARVDRDTMAALPISPVDYNGGELTGTGDGRLFAFAGTGDAELVEYDRGSGEVIDTIALPGLPLTFAFAFAFWGGDFWFFTEGGAIGTPSKVTRLDYDGSDGGGLTTVVTQAPMRVVGAGVSTCAPLLPPG